MIIQKRTQLANAQRYKDNAMRGTKLKIVILMFICAIAALYASCGDCIY